MITVCTFHNIDGITTYDLNSDVAPLNDFDAQVTQRVDLGRPKPNRPGLYPTRTQRGQMQIHCEGVLFANDSAAYFAERMALVLALFGDPAAIITDRKLGTLEVGFDGATENWQTDVTISAFSAPLKGDYPALTAYLVTFESWTPYFTGITTGNKYYYS